MDLSGVFEPQALRAGHLSRVQEEVFAGVSRRVRVPLEPAQALSGKLRVVVGDRDWRWAFSVEGVDDSALISLRDRRLWLFEMLNSNRRIASETREKITMKALEQFDASTHFENSLAAKYDRRIRLFCPSYDALHQMIAAWFRSLPERANFLSAGAGTGAEILTLGKLFPSWRFTAVDASHDMLKACHGRIADAGMVNRVAFFNGQLQEYQSSEIFDAASSVFVSHFIKCRDARLAYFHAVSSNLKPGGVFVLADLFGERAHQHLVSCWTHGWFLTHLMAFLDRNWPETAPILTAMFPLSRKASCSIC